MRQDRDVAPPSRRLVKGSAWVMAGGVIGNGLGLLSISVIVRVITPEQAGAYFLTLSLVGYAATIAQLGMGLTLIRLIAESVAQGNLGRVRSAIRNGTAMAGVGSILVAVLLGAFLWNWASVQLFDSPSMGDLTFIAAALVVAESARRLLVSILRGFHDMRSATLVDVIVRPVVVLSSLGALHFVRPVDSALVVLTVNFIAVILAVILGARILRPTYAGCQGDGSASRSEMLGIGGPIMALSLATGSVGLQSDIWILGATRPLLEVAIYAAVGRIVVVLNIPYTAFASALTPMLAELSATGRKSEIERLTGAAGGMILTLMLGVLALTALFGRAILVSLFGTPFAEGHSVLVILTAANCVFVATGPSGLLLIMTGFQRLQMTMTILVGASTVSCDILVAPQYGMRGVAIVSGCGIALQNLLGWWLAKRRLGVSTHARFAFREWKDLIVQLRTLGARPGLTSGQD